ncbi:MAG: glutamyl-tRNA reductase [Acidobacteriota bacterium]
MRRFVLLGCNHSTASLEDVARAKLPEVGSQEALTELRTRLGADELVYLSTCHRTEWYLAYSGELCPGRLAMALARSLPEIGGGASSLPPVDRCLAMHASEVARHLFRVASALDAMMIGESQVLGQVKEAFRRASEAGLVGPRLTILFTLAFRAGKRVRTETALARRPVSLVSLAERELRACLAASPLPVALVGAGEMAGAAAELVRKIDPSRPLLVFNRGTDRGEALARRLGARHRPLVELTAEGPAFAAVVAATGSPSPLIGADAARRLAPATFLDLGVPPNIAPECAAVPGINLIDQVALRRSSEANRTARAAELARAESIVDEQLEELAYEVMEQELSPVARSLVAAFRDLARSELEKVAAECHAVPADRVHEAAERLSQRLVRVPMRALRAVAWHHSTDVLNTFLRAVKQ